MAELVEIDQRFCGPPDCGNGGYVAGLVASQIDGDAEVRLRLPPPLARPLELRHDGESVELLDGEDVVAVARPARCEVEPPARPSFEEATRAREHFSGWKDHWFPACFVCGPERREGDGLRIFPGPLDALPGCVAAPWVPDARLAGADGQVADEFLWAALDCAGAFAFEPDPSRTFVLGSFAVQLRHPVRSAERCVVVGWPISDEGRKRLAGTALLDETGEVAAVARATWIGIAPAS